MLGYRTIQSCVIVARRRIWSGWLGRLKKSNQPYAALRPDLSIQLDPAALSLGNNYTFDTSLGPLDLLGWLEPVGTYDDLVPQAEYYSVGEFKLRTIGLDDLIRIKQPIGRSKDRDSLIQLLAIQKLRNEERKTT